MAKAAPEALSVKLFGTGRSRGGILKLAVPQGEQIRYMQPCRRFVADFFLRAGMLVALTWLGPIALPAQLAPRLNIQSTDGENVRVEWPVGDGLFALEELEAFDGFDQWRPASQTPRLEPPNFQLELTPTNHTRFFRLFPIVQPDPGVVPEPDSQAPLPPPNVAQSFADSTAFLYTDTNPVQIGVGPGTITAERASVVRGRILKRDGSPLAGVHVRVLHHPEFGFTYTRADGRYDLAVNGGPLYTLDFQLRGYCPVQRKVQATLQDFRLADEVILVAVDPIATPVTFGADAPMQVATSSVNTDKAGSRSATVLFPPGTSAKLLLPDGTTQDRGTLTIRATEFTVGPNGMEAMPAPLPPASSYTYAVELSGDEAVAAGARTIQFDKTVHVYVDNFLDVPAGVLMPSAYYDRDLAAWVPQDNGIVLRMVGNPGGVAAIDLDGDEEPEEAATLSEAAFTTEELRYLAANYPVAKSLWRMPVTHFTAMDFNLPIDPPEKGKPNIPGDGPDEGCKDCDQVGGSVEIAQQIFHETLPLVGTPMDLHYSSARVPGYRVHAQLELPLTGETVPPGLLKAEAQWEIAGKKETIERPPLPHQSVTFSWDGLDAYGRPAGPSRPAAFQLAYYYPRIYALVRASRRGRASAPENFSDLSRPVGDRQLRPLGATIAPLFGLPLFGRAGQFSSTIGHNEIGEAAVIFFERLFTLPDHRQQGLGGWSLTPHHRYDPVGKFLYLGDGRIQRPEGLANGISVTELDPDKTYHNVAAASDGSLFLIERGGHVFRMTQAGQLVPMTAKLLPDGTLRPETLFVGYGDFARIDGKPAAQVRFNQVPWHDVATGPDDSLYLRTFWSILRITPDGIIRVVLGMVGSETFPPDGSFARQPGVAASSSGNGSHLAVGPDHTVYYTEERNVNGQGYDYLRQISPDGRIHTLMGDAGRAAGPFEPQYFTSGGRAIDTQTAPISGLALAPDGSLYVSGGLNMVRIAPGGTVEEVMNGFAMATGHPLNPDEPRSEGKPAVSPTPYRPGGGQYVYNLTTGPDGSPYWHTAEGPGFIWKIAGGLFQRVAGKWGGPFIAGGHPLETQIGTLSDFTVDRAGGLTMLSQPPGHGGSGGNYSLRRIGPAFPGFESAELQVASRDGSELYIFSNGGLHLRTLNTLTGTTNWLFTYDSNNLVSRMQDANGLVTTIERSGAGAPTGIVGPYGQRTTLAVDASGFLASVVNPAQETVQLASDAKGLLLSLTTPGGNTEHLAYDDLGRVVQAQDAAGNTRQYTRTGQTDVFTVHDQAPGGSAKEVKLELLANGDTRIDRQFEDGTTNTEIYSRLGDRLLTDSDGSVITSKVTYDPRFPGQTRVPESLNIALPGGLSAHASFTRSVTLADPANALSLSEATTTTTIDGNAFTRSYTASNRTAVATTPEGRQTFLWLDEAGREQRHQLGPFAPVDTLYDAQGRVTKLIEQRVAAAIEVNFAHDALGRLARITDPVGRDHIFSYDGVGRLTNSTAPDGATAFFEYDADGNLLGITPPGRPTHRFAYDSRGLLVTYTPPLVGGNETPVHFQYNSDHQPDRIILPDDQEILISYNTSGSTDQIALGTGAVISFGYDTNSGVVTNLVSSRGESLALGYQGQLLASMTWSGLVTGRIEMQFDASLRPIHRAINDASFLDCSYDRDGLAIRVGRLTLSRDPESGYVRSTAIDAINDSRTYHENGLLASYTASIHAQPLWSYRLRYDRLNRITNKVETLHGISHTYDYEYDLRGHLARTFKDGSLLATYEYDANGNRLSRNQEAGVYDAQDRVVSYNDTSFVWSPNGTLIRKDKGGQSTAYTYDVAGRLVEVLRPSGEKIEYVLDPIGRRVAKRVNGDQRVGWLYAGETPVAEVDGQSKLTKEFIHAGDALAPSYLVSGTNTYRILSDERGSVRLVVDTQSGALLQQMDYDEFGRVLFDSAPGFQPFGFCSGLYDAETGLVRFGARDYDSESGSWIGRDPSGFLGGSANHFSYCHGEPVNWIDSSGTTPRKPILIDPPVKSLNPMDADYLITTTGVGVKLPVIKGVGASTGVVIDRYGRFYTFVTGNGGKVAGLGGSSAYGKLNKLPCETEEQHQKRVMNFLTGWSTSYGGGFGVGVSQNVSDDPDLGYSWEYGLTTPGGGSIRSYARHHDLSPDKDLRIKETAKIMQPHNAPFQTQTDYGIFNYLVYGQRKAPPMPGRR